VTGLSHRMSRWLVGGAGSVVVASCLAGCEPAKDFSVTNATNEVVTVQERAQHPGQQPSPVDFTVILQPGEKSAIQLGLSRGVCMDTGFVAYDASGQMVAQDPTPICEDKTGHGNSWVIKAK
jgi:hypothetical protein